MLLDGGSLMLSLVPLCGIVVESAVDDIVLSGWTKVRSKQSSWRLYFEDLSLYVRYFVSCRR